MYCARCRRIIGWGHIREHREALISAYDRSIGAFRCYWSSVALKEEGYPDPFYICYDHYIPEKTSKLVVSSELFNLMKNDLGPEEFPRAIKELAHHRNGAPFDRDSVQFIYWAKLVRSPTTYSHRLNPGERSSIIYSDCVICGRRSVKYSIYCPRCRRLVFGDATRHSLRAKALGRAWNPDLDAFACHYTGVGLNDSDRRSPWYITFDHRTPGVEEDIVVAAAWVNAMKTALSEDEFWAVVLEYDRFLRKGGEFDRNVAEFGYWRGSRGRVWR